MRFLDDKEEVINFEMTPYGKHLLSKGQYRPVYYAFHDDDILYDTSHSHTNEFKTRLHASPRNHYIRPRARKGWRVLFKGP